MSSYKYVHPKVNNYFEKNICYVIYHHLKNKNAQRYYDSFRGSLNVCFYLDFVSMEGYLFLNNFVCWLEYKGGITDETENLAYQYFYDDFVKMLGKYFVDKD